MDDIVGRLAPWRRSLRVKIIVPYLILTLVVAVVSAYVITRVFTISSTKAYETRLFESTAAANDAIVQHERQQLAFWRQLAFTAGVDEALATADRAQLQALLEPLYVNARWDRVEIVSSNGDNLLLLDGSEVNTIPANYEEWELVSVALEDPAIRTVGLQTIDNEIILYTAGAIQDPQTAEPAGVLLVGTSLGTLAATIETDVLAGITFYAASGQPLATTVGDYWSVLLENDLATDIARQSAEEQHVRSLQLDETGYTQLLTPFVLNNGQPSGLLGVSLLQSDLATPLDSTRTALIVMFTIMTAATLFIGYILAKSIASPVTAIAAAAAEVAKGNLEVQVDVRTEDEIGFMGQRFNEMVTQLGQRHYIEELLGRYVGKNIARELLGGHADLGGQRVWATVLFSDIRDFTTFTESKDLNSLMDELNEYYEEMQDVINEHGGVINKFGGDSILALFGAPSAQPDHAQQSIRAAVGMMHRLGFLNQRRASRGLAPFNIGIGICTGEMVAGNLGSTERREFTVLGDTVNTASRLSDLNKETPFRSIFVSETVMREANDFQGWEADNMGPVFVKGKIEPVTVFALMPDVISEVAALPLAAD
ncbi:MAG: HAMP domain-containing protein [Anaerolineales bacterium]|nr:HAMP domain-containing protein [Anaerolineales bacterium]MCB8962650.1 HAMP domain-containing protein [Ardenticatenales bacterium]